MTRKRTTQVDRINQASDILAHVYKHGVCECSLAAVNELKAGLAAQWVDDQKWYDNSGAVSELHLSCPCEGPVIRISPVRLRLVNPTREPVEEKPVYSWPREEPLVREYDHDLGCVIDAIEALPGKPGRFLAQLSRAYQQWSAWSRTHIWARGLAWYWGVDGDLYAHAVNQHRKQYERDEGRREVSHGVL